MRRVDRDAIMDGLLGPHNGPAAYILLIPIVAVCQGCGVEGAGLLCPSLFGAAPWHLDPVIGEGPCHTKGEIDA